MLAGPHKSSELARWTTRKAFFGAKRAITKKKENPGVRGFLDWWWGEDSNLGRHGQQIYSLPSLTA